MIIRDATDDDVGACNHVWLSTQPDIDAEPLPDQPLSRHELASGRLLVAEVEGAVVGFGATLTRSGVAYLADLFVLPAHQSSGIGRTLLHALYADHRGPRFTFASTDPRAQRLYEQLGMRAVEPYHYLDAPLVALTPWATDVELRGADRAEIVAVDAAITGRDRRADIDYASALGAIWYVARRGGQSLGAVAVVAPTWWNPWHPRGCRIGPVLADDPDDIVHIFAASLAAHDPVDVVSTFVPSSLPALSRLLHAGFAVVETDLLMASDDAVIDRHRYLPSVDTP